MNHKISHRVDQYVSGPVTVRLIKEMIANAPDDARITIQNHSDYRETGYTVAVSWTT